MALLIDIDQPHWLPDEALRDELAPLLPGVTIHCGRPQAPLDDVVMLATSVLPADVLRFLPKLRLVQKLGAGVESILRNPDLPPDVRVARLAPTVQVREIAEFFLAYVLRGQRNMARHEADQAARRWDSIMPRRADRTTVGVLGLGHIGAHTARLFASLDFRVLGWSRSQKTIEGVDCRAGQAALPALLSECDYVVAILPATPQTRDLFDAALFAAMKPNAVLINAGRGDLIVEAALIEGARPGWARRRGARHPPAGALAGRPPILAPPQDHGHAPRRGLEHRRRRRGRGRELPPPDRRPASPARSGSCRRLLGFNPLARSRPQPAPPPGHP